MQKDVRMILNGRLELHADGKVFKIMPDGRKEEACITISKNMRQATVSLCEEGKQKTYSVNRLIAEAFLPNPENKPYVSYIDGNPANNCVDNLAWTSKSEQTTKAMKRREKFCTSCGRLTHAKDGICPLCKKAQKRMETSAEKEKIALERIRGEFESVNLSELTFRQRKTVELRLQGMSLDEIAEIMGCTKQCIDSRLKAVLKKSGIVKPPGKCARKAYMSARSRLDKKRNLLAYLTEELRFTELEIQQLEATTKRYEEMYLEES